MSATQMGDDHLFGNLFSPPSKGGPPTYIHLISVPLIVTGCALVAPVGTKDLVFHILNHYLGLGVDFSTSTPLGVCLLVVGLLVYIVERWLALRDPQTFIALRHQSFAPISRPLNSTDLPASMRIVKIENIICDVSDQMKLGGKGIESAIEQQYDWLRKITGTLSLLPGSKVGYYGIVHIPFQLLAGHALSTYKKVSLFELDRTHERWVELDDSPGMTTQLLVKRTMSKHQTNLVALRISISYQVPSTDVEAALDGNYHDVHLSLQEPRIDSVTSYVAARFIASRFRRLLDDPELRGNQIHIFYAGPVSLGFVLGQQISPTIHGEVYAYNYDASSTPHYKWFLQIRQNQVNSNVRRI